MFKFNLGDTVKDTITTFVGIVIGRTEWYNGCIRYVVQANRLKDGRSIEPENIDEAQIVLVKKAPKKPEPKIRTGGPFSAVKRGQLTKKQL